MEHIEIAHPSIGQIRKMRKGFPVRIKQGTGFNLIIHPHRYSQISHTFSKNKGIEIALSPEELNANADQAGAMTGGSIFGKKFDRSHKGLMKVLHPIGEVLKPYAKGAISAGTAAGAAALTAAFPEFAPQIAMGAMGAERLGNSYLDNPDKYYAKARDIGSMFKGDHQSNAGGTKSNAVYNMAGKMAKAKANEYLNQQLGTNSDYMNRAGLEQAGIGALQSHLAKSATAQKLLAPPMNTDDSMFGYGLHRRSLGMGFGGIRERGSIGRGAGFVSAGSYMPPALMSQPAGANFQMQHFLPPQYHQYWNPAVEHSYSGMGLGAGLYL